MKSGIFKNKFVAILLIVSVILSACICVSANETEAVTRAHFAQIISEIYKIEAEPCDTQYVDVTAENPASGYINAVTQMGFMSGSDGMFLPDKNVTYNEILKTAVCMLGYRAVAETEGGYPDGYSKIAVRLGICKNISAQNGYVTVNDINTLFENMMNTPVLQVVSYGEYKEGETFMQAILKVSKKSVRIASVNDKTGTIKVYTGREYTETETYFIDDTSIIEDAVGMNATFYVNTAEEKVIYYRLRGKVEVYYDFISKVNDRKDSNASYIPQTFKTVYLKNEDKRFKLSSSTEISFNGERNKNGKYVGSFAKVVVCDDEVINIEAFELADGGIVYRADSEMIKYTNAVREQNILDGLNHAEDIKIYIDGKKSTDIYELKQEMLFDYCKYGDRYIFVASNRSFTGKFDGYSNESVTVGGKEYELDWNKGINVYSDFTDEYIPVTASDTYDLDNMFNKTVKIYVGDNGIVRYMKNVETITNEIDGVVMAAAYDGGNTFGNPQFKIFHLNGDKGKIAVYDTVSNMKSSPISVEYAMEMQANTSGKGIFRFVLNDEGKIAKIMPIPHFGNRIQVKSISRNSYIINDLMYLQASTECALYMKDGEFCAELVYYLNNPMRRGMESGYDAVTVVTDYDIRYNPKPKYLVYADNAEHFIVPDDQIGILTEVTPRADGTHKLVLADVLRGNVGFIVTNQFVKDNGLKKNMLVRYHRGFLGDNPIKIDYTYDLSGDPSQWQTDTFTNTARSGFFAADRMEWANDYGAQFVVNGELTDPIAFNTDWMNFFELKVIDGRVKLTPVLNKAAPLANVHPDDKVWFNVIGWYEPRQINMIIYQKGDR